MAIQLDLLEWVEPGRSTSAALPGWAEEIVEFLCKPEQLISASVEGNLVLIHAKRTDWIAVFDGEDGCRSFGDQRDLPDRLARLRSSDGVLKAVREIKQAAGPKVHAVPRAIEVWS